MKDRSEFDGFELPADLAELDAELSSISYVERPSFGPELEAELERVWQEERDRVHPPYRRLLAAGVAGLLMVGLGVPQARAALVRLVGLGTPGTEAVAQRPQTPPPLSFAFDAQRPPVAEEVPEAAPRIPLEPPEGRTVERYAGPEATFPELADLERTEALILEHYPEDLQRAGIGGTVRLLLWVDSTGAVDFVNLKQGSGIHALDREAMQVAPSFAFLPARRRGRAVETWVEFDVTFRPPPVEPRPWVAPEVAPVRQPDAPEEVASSLVPDWTGDPLLPSPSRRGAGELLRTALDDDDLVRRLGPIEAILDGEPPAGVAPTQWRAEVAAGLERAMVRDPDNPAPLLALGRIRRKQGLRTEARVLFERGLQRAVREGDLASPELLADLHYERGMLVKERWLSSRGVGRVSADQMPVDACAQARSSGGAGSGDASVDRLIAWNYLCPARLDEILDRAFVPSDDRGADRDRAVMTASFRSAVESFPAHVGANVEILLALADEGRWDDLLDGARRFVWASRGHPYGLLLTGLAYQRLSRTEDALGQFELAFRVLAAEEAEELRDVRGLLSDEQRAAYPADPAGRAEWVASFWDTLDPILSTSANEREAEHLARAGYAHLRFGGVHTDPGEVWVRYGRPLSVRVVAEGGGVRTEFWDYGRGRPDITFRRLAAAASMDLTTEGRAYVDELRSVFPHRYGTASRLVFTLPGQISRFRGATPGSTELEVYTEVPELLATGDRDTLDLGVFLLDEQGRKLSVTQRRLEAVHAPVSLDVPASPEVAAVVVEFYNRATGQAAAIRERAALEDRGAAGAAVSDLLLTEVASPSSDAVRRRASWLQPERLTGPIRGDALGLLFELYDVGQATSWYRLRAEVEDRTTGRTLGVPIRPAGQSGFRPTWDRLSTGEGETAEFVSVALSDVPPGTYTLRMVVDLPDAGAPLVVEREVRRE